MNKRPIPEAALEDPNSVEMLSVWIAQRNLHCSLKVGMYKAMGVNEEAAWGRILADAARHISNAFAETEGVERQSTLDKIEASFIKELSSPTSEASGKFVKKN